MSPFERNLEAALELAEARGAGWVVIHPHGFKELRARKAETLFDEASQRDTLALGHHGRLREVEIRVSTRLAQDAAMFVPPFTKVLPPAGYVGAALYKPLHA